MAGIIRIVLAAWAIIKIVSRKLWIADRTFPQVTFLTLPAPVQIMLWLLFFAAAAYLFLKPFHCLPLCVLLVAESFSMLSDEVRWQPWQYQFLFILLAVLINRKHLCNAISCIILILSSTYFFSGLHKLNSSFLQNIWLRLIVRQFFYFSPAVYQSHIIRYTGLLIPALEISAGILLLLPKQKKVYALLPVSIHVFIWLWLTCTRGIMNNQTVLPWNAAMAIMIYILFIRNKSVFSFSPIWQGWNIAFAAGCIILPFLGLFGYWDSYLSSGVYRGNEQYMSIYLPDKADIPAELAPYVTKSHKAFDGRHQKIDLQSWCVKELKVTAPPESRVYKSIEVSFAKKYSYLHPIFRYY